MKPSSHTIVFEGPKGAALLATVLCAAPPPNHHTASVGDLTSVIVPVLRASSRERALGVLMDNALVPGKAFEYIWATALKDPALHHPLGISSNLASDKYDHSFKIDFLTQTSYGILGMQMTTSVSSDVHVHKKQQLIRASSDRRLLESKNAPRVLCLFTVNHPALSSMNRSYEEALKMNPTLTYQDINEGIYQNPLYHALHGSKTQGGILPSRYLDTTLKDMVGRSVLFYEGVASHFSACKNGIGTFPTSMTIAHMNVQIVQDGKWCTYSYKKGDEEFKCDFLIA